MADRQSAGCGVCGFSPASIFNQSVIAGISAVSVSGKSVAVVDAANHRVLVWRDASSDSARKGADVILGTNSPQSAPVNASTLVEPISVTLDGQRLFVGDGALHRVLVWNALPQSDNQPADVVLGQPDFSSSILPDVPAADTIARPVALDSDGLNLFVADSVTRRILVFTAADAPLPGSAVTNSASLASGPLAPGALLTISVSGLTRSPETAPDGADEPLPRKLSGVEVIFDGVALPLLSVSSDEVRAQLPYDAVNRTSSSMYIRSERDGGAVTDTNAVAISLLPAAPGLFAFPGKEPRPGITLHGGTVAAPQGAPVTSSSPAHPDEAITLWAAGLGLVNASDDSESGVQAGVPNPHPDAPVQLGVAATVNGYAAQVLSATLPQGSIGIYEVRVLLPVNLPSAAAATLAISQNGRPSNIVTIPVQNGIQ
jgi:uncharacterized protein (TIGR03437 family)